MKESLSSREFIPERDTRVVVMAGGKGTRLAPITGGRIPKDFVELKPGERGIDRTLNTLSGLGLKDVVYSANHFIPDYLAEFSKHPCPPTIHYQHEGDSHGTDLERVIKEQGTDKQYLILATDIYCSPSDIKKLLDSHTKGTVSWSTSRQNFEGMDIYRNLITENNAVIGSRRSPYQNRTPVLDEEYIMKGAIFVTDPEVFLRGMKLQKRLLKKETGIDLYSDIANTLFEVNRRLIVRNRQSFIRPVFFDAPYIDYGDPKKLEMVRRMLHE